MLQYFLKSKQMKMIASSSSTNPEIFILLGHTSCTGGRNPMETPQYCYPYDNSWCDYSAPMGQGLICTKYTNPYGSEYGVKRFSSFQISSHDFIFQVFVNVDQHSFTMVHLHQVMAIVNHYVHSINHVQQLQIVIIEEFSMYKQSLFMSIGYKFRSVNNCFTWCRRLFQTSGNLSR